MQGHEISPIEKFLAQINENLEFLKLKISKRGIKTGDVKYYLPDLLNNAYRRIEEGKYDDAVARLYRSIELTAQLGLVNEGVVDVNVFAPPMVSFPDVWTILVSFGIQFLVTISVEPSLLYVLAFDSVSVIIGVDGQFAYGEPPFG